MANIFMQQMSARTEGWRENFLERPEERQVMRYAGYGLLALVISRLVIEISRHVAFLMPFGIMAALVFSAFELALAAAGLILGAIVIAAVVGLSTSSLLRLLKVIR